jgi:4-hydroxy-tetrahydrodipicolinate synthase
MELGRVLTALVTPFDHELRVDYGRAVELVERLLGEGSDGFVVCGTTGESPTLTHDEKLRMFDAVKEAVGGRGTVIANTGTNSTAASVELTKEVAGTGVDGVMAVVPYYSKPTQDGIRAHFTAIASATDLPVILYNIPGRTGCLMSAETTAALSRVPNVVGVKDAVGNLEYTTAVAREAREGFLIYSGDDSLTLPILSVGGYGAISAGAHIASADIQAMLQAFLAGDISGARRLHLKMAPLFKALFCTTNPIGVKCALQEEGLDSGGLRLPLTEATPEQRAVIRAALDSYRGRESRARRARTA